MSEPTPVPEDLQELWVADESALDREDVVTPIPIAHPVAAPGWFNYPALFGIPLLLLVLGLGAYGLFRNYPGEEAIQENPEEQVTAPENAPGAALTPTETTSATQTPVPNEEPELTQSGQPGGEEQIATETFEQRRNENSNPEHSSAYRSAAPPKRQAPAERTTERNRTTASNRTGRATRPRVVDEDFEQPPVSSIESIMTGIPADRPRRQSRWEVWEEDQLRRERRIRRRNRRNLQRYPLY